MNTRRKIVVFAVIVMMSLTALGNAGGLLGGLLKVGGVGFVVEKFGGQINDFVNKLTLKNSVETKDTTAVVPIITLGSGGYIGAAQVIGKKDDVAKCKAVVQIEGNALFGSSIRAKALVPVSVKSTKDIKRLEGVGVSAIIDIKI